MFFRKPASQPKAVEAEPPALVEPAFKDGKQVKCQKCGKALRVRYFGKGDAIIVSPREKESIALRCLSCGAITCDNCAHPPTSAFPVCPNCNREWGPYYFTRGAEEPGGGAPVPPPAWKTALESIPELGASVHTTLIEDKPKKKKPERKAKLNLKWLKPVLIILFVLATVGGGGYALIQLMPQITETISAALARSSPVITPTVTLAADAQSSSPAPADEVPTSFQPTPTPTASGCVSPLSVTLADLGKILCVEGTVLNTKTQNNAFIISFSDQKGAFYIVVYDRVYSKVKPGVCVRVKGEIKQLGNNPVIALLFNDPVEICP